MRVVAAPDGCPPFAVEAVALEDDTYSVLSADPEVREPTEHPIRIWTELHETEPSDPGSVIVKEGLPLRLLAVIRDLSRDPSWTEEWVTSALRGILREVEARRLRGLALQLLGCVHGRLPVERFAELLHESLERERPACLERVWLVATPEQRDRLSALTLDD